MHRVVLLVHIVEVTGILVDSVGTEKVLEEQESIVVFVLHRWCIIEDTNVGVDHLVVSDEEKSGDVDSFLGVGARSGIRGGRQGRNQIRNWGQSLSQLHPSTVGRV